MISDRIKRNAIKQQITQTLKNKGYLTHDIRTLRSLASVIKGSTYYSLLLVAEHEYTKKTAKAVKTGDYLEVWTKLVQNAV